MARVSAFKPAVSLTIGFDPFRNDRFGRGILRPIMEDYGGRLDIPESQGEREPFAGSSTFFLFAVDEKARPRGARVANLSEYDLSLALGIRPEPGTYRDFGVFMDFSGRNHKMAVKLLKSLTEEHRDLDMFPAILTGLVTRLDDRNPHGLTLRTSDSYAYGITPAKILAGKGGSFRKGGPSLVREGETTLYIAKQKSEKSIANLGLSNLRLYDGLDAGPGANYGDLASSSPGGRILLVSKSNKGVNTTKYFVGLRECLAEYSGYLRRTENRYRLRLEELQSRISAKITGLPE